MLRSYGENSEFEAAIKRLEGKSKNAVQKGKDESKTIHSVILPFIDALGYDAFDDEEVVPEFSADVGIKSGEKVDYALKVNGKPIVLIEVKAATTALSTIHQSQLFRYFTTTDVRIAILTNGVDAWFYSDLNKSNVMDDEPFFKFNFQTASDDDINFLKCFCKNNFSIYNIIEQAQTLKHADEIKNYIKTDIINPNEEFVYFIGKAIMGNRPRKHEIETFRKSIKSAFAELTQKTEIQSTTAPTINDSRPISIRQKTHEPKQARGNHLKYLKRKITKQLYLLYTQAIKEIAVDVNETNRLKHCFLYCKGEKDFVSIMLQKDKLKLGFYLDRIERLQGLNNGVGSFYREDGTMKGRHGIGDFFLIIDKSSNYDYVVRQLKLIYEAVK